MSEPIDYSDFLEKELKRLIKLDSLLSEKIDTMIRHDPIKKLTEEAHVERERLIKELTEMITSAKNPFSAHMDHLLKKSF